MTTHSIELFIPHEQLEFFAGLFLGQIASTERTAEQKNIAKKNYQKVKPFLDKEQQAAVNDAAAKLFDPQEYEWYKKEVETLVDKIKDRW